MVSERPQSQTAYRDEQSKNHEKREPAHERAGAIVSRYQEREREREPVRCSILEGFAPVAPRAKHERSQPPGNETVPAEEGVLWPGRSDHYADNDRECALKH